MLSIKSKECIYTVQGKVHHVDGSSTSLAFTAAQTWPWVFFSACPLAFRAHPSVPLPLIALCLWWPPKLNYLRSPDARGLRDGTRRCCASGCNSPSAGAALLWCHWIGKTFSPLWGWNVCVQRCNDNHIISQLRECIPAAQRPGRGLEVTGDTGTRHFLLACSSSLWKLNKFLFCLVQAIGLMSKLLFLLLRRSIFRGKKLFILVFFPFWRILIC